MPDSLGFRRLMAKETNVSDLLQYLTERDPAPWTDLAPDTVRADRETRIGRNRRADLMLRSADGEVTGGVEVKLGHDFDESQATAYETTLDADEPLLLLGLDVDAEAARATGERWQFVHLSTLVPRWIASPDPEAAAVASAMSRVLSHWDTVVSGVFAAGDDAEPLSLVQEPFVARVVARALQSRLGTHDGIRTFADVTLGGGNATLMAFREIPGEDPGREFLAEVRWSIPKQIMDLRFGLDYPSGSRERRQAVWDAAQRMDDVIAADRLIAHLTTTGIVRADYVTAKGTGRPGPKGNWLDIVRKGFATGDAKHYNPGFVRDKDSRLEATARIDLSLANGADLEPLLVACLDYLAERWRPAGNRS